ncbi:hypothetical protein DOTSEDRAFT_73007 [Dothistroma septosporum NZE10]|uniref:F-box domain-containing protein n=1 Tax=Dothistroma septosporum (strain NZE10 / CBS 128990) TaxID=675120 RepID=N1PHK9_DOTSN|nr:hypothetical protein DOTSEDRAFT_73007 [Dothistroma septosporum NZE10]
MPEYDQSKCSVMMSLPAELRNRIYEAALEYDSTTQPAMAPQLLSTCKQIRREAQGILDGTIDQIALIRISNTNRTLISHGFQEPTEVQAIDSLDTAFESWAPIFGEKSYALVDIQLIGDGKDTENRPEATYPLVCQQLYLLATALARSKIEAVQFQLTLRDHIATTIDYNKFLQPLRRIPQHIQVTMHGVPDSTQARLSVPSRLHPRLQGTGLAVWLQGYAEAEPIIRLIESAGAGIEWGGIGLKFLVELLRYGLPSLQRRALIDGETDAGLVQVAREVDEALLHPMWFVLQDQAEQRLRAERRVS